MKWFWLIVVLIIGGVLYYNSTKPKDTRPTTLQGTANAFMSAALSGDIEGAKALATPEFAGQVEAIAQRIKSAGASTGFQWRPSNSDTPGHEALTTLYQGQPLTIEMVKDGEKYYKVATVAF